ncbi:MAG: hypothetical protein LIO65_05930 [Odoribacter sp.]|nr:hypothetical protein [Odoribacter sp.]
MKKRLLSLLMAVIMLFSLLTVNGFAEEDSASEAETDTVIYEDGEDCVAYSPELTEYEGDDDYQILHIDVDESDNAEIYYTAVADCTLTMNIIDDDTEAVISVVNLNAAEGESAVVSTNLGNTPEYYSLEVFLESGNTVLSDVFTYYDKTREYQDFLSAEISDEEFSDNVVVDFGMGSNGLQNFVAVSEDVKVVYVDSMDDIEIENDYVGEDEVALFSTADEKTTYTFTDAENEEVLKSIEEGDKVLILPSDDSLQMRTLIAAETEVVTLFDGEEVVSVTASDSEEAADASYFDYARINISEERSNPDIDFSDMDDDLEIIDQDNDEITLLWTEEAEEDETDEEEAELFKSETKSAEASASVSKDVSGFTIKDKLSVTVGLTYSYEEKISLTKLKKVSVEAYVDTTNKLSINTSKSASINNSWTIGHVLLYNYDFPIKLYASMTVGASLDASTTQTAHASVKGTWNRSTNKVTTETSASASSTYDFELQGKLTCKIGVGTEQSLPLFGCTVKAGVQAGVQIDGTVTAIKSTDSYTHECDFCLYAEAKPYYSGKVYVKVPIVGVILNKSPSGTGDIFLKFHVSKRDGKYYIGSGKCDYYSYKITFKATNSSGTALKSAEIYKGSTSSKNKLGTTGSKGTYSKKILRGTYTFKVKKSGYTTLSKKYTVSGAATVTFKMSKSSGANETYYTIDDLLELTDDEYDELTADRESLHDIIFTIADENDLVKLSDFVNTSGKDTTGLRFVLNNTSGTMDLSSVDFSPIGTEDNPFKGELDGNSFVITDLNVNSSSSGSGFFGNVSGAYIYNLGIEAAVVDGADNTGILAGYADEQTIIKNCYVTGTVSGSSNVGGLVGVSNESEITNCYSTADVSGSGITGGVVGAMEHTASLGSLNNCYSMGSIQSDGTVGGVVGSMTYSDAVSEDDTTDDTDTEETDSEEDLVFTGIQYCYYLDTSASDAVGSSDSSNVIIAYPVSEEQATGADTAEYITDDTDSFAFAYSLKDALNAWCISFGNTSDEELTETEEDDDTETTVVSSNAYKEWYDDVSLTNGGYPLFAEKSPVYELTVSYVYEDGSEAMPSVVLYLEEGQAYDVDSYVINGYSTDDIEYTGIMPGYDVELRVIYTKDDVFDGTVSELLSSGAEAESGQSYSVNNTADLTALAEYVNTGKNTSGVTFKQTTSIDMTDVEFTPIGTESTPFEGTYSGNYAEISNLSYSGSADYSGLFGYAKNAVFDNIYLSGTITGGNYIGGFVGYAENSNIDNITLTELTVLGSNYIGGIAGCAVSTTFNLSSVDGNISGSSYVGGIAGSLDNSVVKNVSVSGTVTGNSYVGGISGNTLSGEILNSYNLGTVGSSTASNAGGIVGAADSAIVENCYNAGEISGTSNVGSLAGVGNENVTANYYLEGTASASVGSGSEGTNNSFTSDTIDDVTDSLNAWIEAANTAGLYKWYVGDESIYPVFGVLDNAWLTDYSVDGETLTFTYNDELYEDSTVYAAVYSADGSLVSINSYTDGGSYSVGGLSEGGYVRLYIWNVTTQEPEDDNVTINA